MSAKFPGIIQPAEEPEVQVLDDILAAQGTAASQALKGNVSGSLQTPAGVAITPVRKNQVVAASGTDTAIIAAVTGKSIRVFAADLDCAGTATVFTFNSKPSGAGTAIAGPYNQAISESKGLEFNPHGWFQTAVGEGLSCTTGAGSNTTVLITYGLV